MLIAVDIGNTNVVVGVFEGPTLKAQIRLASDLSRTEDEYAAVLSTLLVQKLESRPSIDGAVICSVVPPLTPVIDRFLRQTFGVEPLVIGPGVKTGLQIKISEPGAVGADRVVNARAARELFGAPVLVVDFGTATSIDYVSADGSYQGGVIAPGVTTALGALVERTAKLPRIELCWPKTLVGKSTVAAMQSGAVAGYLYLVDGLLEGIMKEEGISARIVATGGLGALFAQHSRFIEQYVPDLTLTGMRLIYNDNQK